MLRKKKEREREKERDSIIEGNFFSSYKLNKERKIT
jgi:hypothetical protein